MIQGSFTILSSRTLARGKLLEMVELVARSGSGEEVVREVVRHPGGVAILPIDGDDVWLIRQHRVALGRNLVEIPAGKLESTDGDLEAAARRELSEELGAVADRVERIATMAPSPGWTDEVIEIFVAEGLEFGSRAPDGAEEREATVFSVPISQALDSIASGEITDAKTLVALLEWNRRRA